jgi:UDPglucose 6-dehydrogenase
MNITFIGTGYVGLVSGVMMSHLGHNVTCLDTDSDKIAGLKQGILPIYEPELDKYLSENITKGRLRFIDNYNDSLQDANAIFITVGTPSLPSGEADLQYIFAAIDNICQYANKNCVFVIKSTVPPGTCNRLSNYLIEQNFQFDIASNPEFLREGCAVEDFLNPDRIVIGTNKKEAENLLKEIYAPMTSRNIPIVACNRSTSELIKYASNSFLATKIAFINEMANLCEKIDGDIKQLSFGVGLDSRIGEGFLKAGPGFGGSCFPKDILALAAIAKSHSTECKVIEAVINANQKRPKDIVEKIAGMLGTLANKVITVLGLSFKAGTDDIRSSPAVEIIKLLQENNVTITVFDPVAMNNGAQYLDNLQYASSAAASCQKADAIIIATEWEEFATLDFLNIVDNSNLPIIIDLRNILDHDKLKQQGFRCYSVGKRYEI